MSTQTTKENILTAALKVFAQKGFAGASISQIAKIAQINQSLIYHHFESKEDLWVNVKKYCVDEAVKDFQPISQNNLENFVHDLIDRRFSVYEKDNMRQLIHWQALEKNTSKFYEKKGCVPHSLFDIANHIKLLQNRGIVRKDKDFNVLSGIIFGLVSYAFFDFANAYSLSQKQRNSYKKLVYDILIEALKPPKPG